MLCIDNLQYTQLDDKQRKRCSTSLSVGQKSNKIQFFTYPTVKIIKISNHYWWIFYGKSDIYIWRGWTYKQAELLREYFSIINPNKIYKEFHFQGSLLQKYSHEHKVMFLKMVIRLPSKYNFKNTLKFSNNYCAYVWNTMKPVTEMRRQYLCKWAKITKINVK